MKFFFSFHSYYFIMNHQNFFDTIIIGAGISGIAAALSLQQNKSDWLVLQAQDHIGGRIQSIVIDDTKVDTGAYELAVKGEKSQKSLAIFKYIRQKNYPLEYRISKSKILYVDETGEQVDEKDHEIADQIIEEMFDYARKKIKEGVKASLYETIQHFLNKYLGQKSQLSSKQQRLLNLKLKMVQQEEAADIHELSLFTAGFQDEDEMEYDGFPLPVGTYEKMLKQFASDLPNERIKLKQKVVKVQKEEEITKIEVIHETKQIQIYSCKKVICSVPLSILKSGKIEFSPMLPPSHQQAIKDISYGVMDKVILAFEKPFWTEDTLRIKIASSYKGKFPHFINLSTEKSHILCCFITDIFSKQLHSKYSDKEIAQQTVQFLKQTFQNKQIILKDFHVTNWASNQFLKGSFSFFGPNCNMKTIKTIRSPIDNWLWFAGQYCYGENMGCAHGAFEIGYQAGKQIVALQKK